MPSRRVVIAKQRDLLEELVVRQHEVAAVSRFDTGNDGSASATTRRGCCYSPAWVRRLPRLRPTGFGHFELMTNLKLAEVTADTFAITAPGRRALVSKRWHSARNRKRAAHRRLRRRRRSYHPLGRMADQLPATASFCEADWKTMKLTNPGKYAHAVERLEQNCELIEELASLEVPIQVLESFERFLALGKAAAYGTTPALYHRLDRTIYINDPVFSVLPGDEQESVLIHEVAHAHLHAAKHPTEPCECDEADLLACQWGYADALIRNRSNVDAARGSALALFLTDGVDAARQKLAVLCMQKLAGIR